MANLEFEQVVFQGRGFLARQKQFIAKVNNDQGNGLSEILQSIPGSQLIWSHRSWGVFRFPQNLDLFDTIRKVRAAPQLQPFLSFIEPDVRVKGLKDLTTPVDAVWQWGLSKMGMDAAWHIQKGGDNVFVVIVDSGIVDHPELNPNRMFHGGSFLFDDPATVPPVIGKFQSNPQPEIEAEHNHGVMVAGIVAANDDKLGVKGINLNSRIGICRALDAVGDGSTSSVLAAVLHAIEGAKAMSLKLIVNLSIELDDDPLDPDLFPVTNGPQLSDAEPASEIISTFKFMAEAAKGAGAILVCGAGNDGEDVPKAPAVYAKDFPDAVMAVGYTQAKTASGLSIGDEFLHPSTHGGVDVVAPGTDWPVLYKDQTIMSYNGVLIGAEGSSLAAPHVAGIASLVWSEHPGLSAADVISRIKKTAETPGGVGGLPDSKWGFGRVNAFKALSGGI